MVSAFEKGAPGKHATEALKANPRGPARGRLLSFPRGSHQHSPPSQRLVLHVVVRNVERPEEQAWGSLLCAPHSDDTSMEVSRQKGQGSTYCPQDPGSPVRLWGPFCWAGRQRQQFSWRPEGLSTANLLIGFIVPRNYSSQAPDCLLGCTSLPS